MKRGICPAGHLEQVGEVGDRCKHVCADCGTTCNKKLKQWSSGYISEICPCIEVPKSNSYTIDLFCPSGHAEWHRRSHSNQCHYTCSRCGRVCGRTLQYASDVYSDVWCECYDDTINDTHTHYQETKSKPEVKVNIDYIFDDTQGDPLDNKFCESLFSNIPFDESPPKITYSRDINQGCWRLY